MCTSELFSEAFTLVWQWLLVVPSYTVVKIDHVSILVTVYEVHGRVVWPGLPLRLPHRPRRTLRVYTHSVLHAVRERALFRVVLLQTARLTRLRGATQ